MIEKQTGRKINEKDTRINFYDLARTLVLVLTSQKVYMGWLSKPFLTGEGSVVVV